MAIILVFYVCSHLFPCPTFHYGISLATAHLPFISGLACFNGFLWTLSVREGFLLWGCRGGQIHNIWHWADAMDSRLFVTYLYTHCSEEGTLCHAVTIAVVLGNRMDNWGQWEADFVLSRGGGDPRRKWLACSNLCGLVGNWNLLLWDKQELCVIPVVRVSFGYGVLSVEHCGEWKLWLGCWRTAPDVKAVHNIRPYFMP